MSAWRYLIGIAVAMAMAVGTAHASDEKHAAIVVDAMTGKVLYSRSADEPRYPASLTKVLTLYLLFERLESGKLKLTTPLKASAEAARQAPSKIGIKAGQTITVDQAIRALAVKSANDVAVVVAEALAGDEDAFAILMTKKAHELGMKDSHFYNASGLPHDLQQTTARDMALLGRRVIDDFPQYAHYFALKQFTWRRQRFRSHNNILSDFEGSFGLKTGYTRASGFNLIGAAQRDDVRLIAVVMGGKTANARDGEIMSLMEEQFARIEDNPALVAKAPPLGSTAVAAVSEPEEDAVEVAESEDAAEISQASATAVTAALNERAARTAETAAARRVAAAGQAQPTSAPVTIEEAVATFAENEDTPPEPLTPAQMLLAAASAQALPPQTPAVAVAAAAPIPLPASAPVEQGDTGDQTDIAALSPAEWGIQIGAFADEAAARTALAALADRAQSLLAGAGRAVAPISSAGSQTLYRARFGPFSLDQSREVCRQLTELGVTCFSVRHPDWVARRG